jgi:predicted MFS family arabinose efflux permease
MAFLPTPILASAAYLGRGALMNMAQPLRSAFYMEAVRPDSRPAVNSLMLVSWNVAWAGGSAAGGALLGAGLSQIQFGLTATLYALASILLLVAFNSRRGHDPTLNS